MHHPHPIPGKHSGAIDLAPACFPPREPLCSEIPAAGPLHAWRGLGCPAWLPRRVLPWPQELSHPSCPPELQTAGSALCTGRKICSSERACAPHWVPRKGAGRGGISSEEGAAGDPGLCAGGMGSVLCPGTGFVPCQVTQPPVLGIAWHHPTTSWAGT